LVVVVVVGSSYSELPGSHVGSAAILLHRALLRSDYIQNVHCKTKPRNMQVTVMFCAETHTVHGLESDTLN